MRNLNLNFNGKKKGNVILDSIMVLIVLTLFSVLTIVGYKIFNDLNTDIQADNDVSDTAKSNLNSLNTRFPTFMDNAFIIALVLLTILAIAFSFYIDTNPFFFIVAIVLLLAVLFIGGTGITGLVGVFVYGSSQRKKERVVSKKLQIQTNNIF